LEQRGLLPQFKYHSEEKLKHLVPIVFSVVCFQPFLKLSLGKRPFLLSKQNHLGKSFGNNDSFDLESFLVERRPQN